MKCIVESLRQLPRHGLAACLATAFAVDTLATPATVHAGTLVVTNCNDDGAGSLREAVANAFDNDNIYLGQLSCSAITLTTGAIAIGVDNLAITTSNATSYFAQGSIAPLIDINGGGVDRVFNHAGNGVLALTYLTLRNGSVDGNGGCVRSSGSVYLDSVNISGCHAHDSDYLSGRGGGVYASNKLRMDACRVVGNSVDGLQPFGGGVFAAGTLRMRNSTISGNTALGNGIAGGVYARTDAGLYNSTIADNRAGNVGGLFFAGNGGTGTPVGLVHSTVSGNQGDRIGGVVAFQAPLHLVNSTVAFNTATFANGAGGVALGTDSTMSSSIIALNTSASSPSDIARANGGSGTPVISGDNNLIMLSSLAVPGDTLAQDPQLAPLADNGGMTLTHALLPGSPAIDRGNNLYGAKYDQRGAPYTRTIGASADIGAFEFGAHEVIFIDGFDPHARRQTDRVR